MRLGQLSRKIGVQPSRISDFLEGKNFTLEAGSNSKLSEEQEQLVKSHFDYQEEEIVEAVPKDIEEVDTKENLIIEEDVAQEKIEVIDENTAQEPIEKIEEISEVQEETQSTSESDEEIEIIRAPKLKLEGLKVVGKIDLPEPKTKEEATEATDSSESKEREAPVVEVKEKPVRRKINNPKNYNRRPQKRALTLEEKQERAERHKKRKSKEEKEKQKQFKTAHYESKMRERKPISPKKNKRKSTKITENHITKASAAPVPKTLWGKFIRWLNT